MYIKYHILFCQIPTELVEFKTPKKFQIAALYLKLKFSTKNKTIQ